MYIVHYSQQSRGNATATLHRDGCGKVPFEGIRGHKRQGVPVTVEQALAHARDVAQTPPSTYLKVCLCARKALRDHAAPVPTAKS